MTSVGDFTLTEDEASGDYHIDTSQKSTRHLRANVENYEKTGVYTFVKLFKNKTDGEFTLVQKFNLTEEDFEKLLAAGKSVLQIPKWEEGYQKAEKRRKHCSG